MHYLNQRARTCKTKSMIRRTISRFLESSEGEENLLKSIRN